MKAVYILFFAILCNSSFAQSNQNYNDIKLETAEQCQAANPAALQAANYILSTPFKEEDVQRLQSLSFILRWMEATPDFTFNIDETATKLSKENNELLGLYITAMTKYCLENKAMAEDQKQVKLNAVILVLNYCENKNNNFKMTKQLKKLSEAKAKGKLEEAI